MVMEKPSPLLVGREFVRQYYTLLNQAPDMLHRFYGKNSSYVHGGLDSNGKPADAVYGQKEIHRKVMSQNFTNCHTKIRHVDAHATLNDGVVVQVMGLLSNNNQALQRFMQTFVLAPEGSVANKFYVHNDIFRYQDEVFGGFVTEPQVESEEEVEEPEERQQTPEVVPDDSGTFYDPTNVRNFRRAMVLQSSFGCVQGPRSSSCVDYGNVVELRINSGGKLPNFGFVVFDDSEPVQRVLSNKPIMFRGAVRLNVEEKKTRAAREGDRRDNRIRGPGGPRGGLSGGMRGPPRGGMVQKPGFGVGRGIAPRQ
ncbi:ras GTPase-activating protein-binding protein 1-like [Nannospalax galili]|uniref:ras GTPase-activating protein-binding protein 1-like n=1 Tax=Nannospalax galili TaxID=1026970 RepID=UPI0004ED1FA5|nr:ras GTPase-activating protein-binding protein 1-like [Nannospalax galili]